MKPTPIFSSLPAQSVEGSLNCSIPIGNKFLKVINRVLFSVAYLALFDLTV